MPIQVLIESNFWHHWLAIACEHERLAAEARSRSESTDESEAITEEFRASMVAISASAHALDAFYGKVKNVEPLPADLENSWKGEKKAPRVEQLIECLQFWKSTRRTSRTARQKQILETLKISFAVGKQAEAWIADLKWLFDLRDSALHYGSKPQPTVPHPTKQANVAQANLDYNLEAAKRAVAIATEVMTTCIESPDPKRPGAREWVEEMPHVPAQLRELRSHVASRGSG